MQTATSKSSSGRWWIAGLLAVAMLLNYLDRQSLPLVIGEIKKEFGNGHAAYARLESSYGWLRLFVRPADFK